MMNRRTLFGKLLIVSAAVASAAVLKSAATDLTLPTKSRQRSLLVDEVWPYDIRNGLYNGEDHQRIRVYKNDEIVGRCCAVDPKSGEALVHVLNTGSSPKHLRLERVTGVEVRRVSLDGSYEEVLG